jgi:hypothetical protein
LINTAYFFIIDNQGGEVYNNDMQRSRRAEELLAMILEETEEIGELIKQIKGVAPVKKYTYLALCIWETK